jgi:hypothetical protein
MVVFLKKGNIINRDSLKSGGSIQVHQVVDDTQNKSYLPGGIIASVGLGTVKPSQYCETSTISKSIPIIHTGGHLNSLMNLSFRNKDKKGNIKLKL